MRIILRCAISGYRNPCCWQAADPSPQSGCSDSSLYRVRMAEVIPPARTPKPITASTGSELLEPGRGSASLLSLSLFAGDGIAVSVREATSLVPAAVVDAAVPAEAAPAEEDVAVAPAGLAPWVCGGCAHNSATNRQITPTSRNCQ